MSPRRSRLGKFGLGMKDAEPTPTAAVTVAMTAAVTDTMMATATRSCAVGMAFVALSLAACKGVVTNPADPIGSVSALCQNRDPGPTVIRRLTRLEYGNTVRQLLQAPAGAADAFPAEERRFGFDNNAAALSTSPALVEQYMLAAEKAATDAVNGNLGAVVPCDPAVVGVDACGQQFITTFGAKAYRAPLDADDVALLSSVFDVGKATDFKTGVRLVIETLLQSPRFLYRVELGAAPQSGETFVKLDDWEMASRLSYLLWRGPPDDILSAAAAAGQLNTAPDIDAQVVRMMEHPNARAMVADFHNQWLRVADIAAVEKAPTAFPTFSPQIAALMQQETAQFLDYVTWEGGGDLAALFGAPFSFMNSALARYYGAADVSGNAFVKVPLDGGRRAGVLTQGGILSLLGKADQTSPVHRGKFVREQLLCMELPPPPADAMIKPPALSTTLTTRERFTQHAADVSCSACHRLMDPIGLGFENFDGAGLFRDVENGRQVDASGELLDSDVDGPFNGILELQTKLATSKQVRACVATKWFRYGYGRGETTDDVCNVATIENKFAKNGYKLRDLLVALTQTDAFRFRRVTPAAGGVAP